MTPLRRGEIYAVNFERSEGARIKKTRPAVIIQNDVGNHYAPHTIVAAIRAAEGRGFLPVFVRVPKSAAGLTKDSLIDCGQSQPSPSSSWVDAWGRCPRNSCSISTRH
jgi:mRNA interferase MazF